MPNVASVLREEIIRLARKEIRPLVGPLKKSNTELRRTVSALNKKVAGVRANLPFTLPTSRSTTPTRIAGFNFMCESRVWRK
ncbi:MAG: hypothetical protein V3T86_09305 [Planctomycetota bacterium]